MLTTRQREVARLIAGGMTQKAVARQLGIAVPTVRDHIVEAARRIPGDGPPRHKITVWFLRLSDEGGGAT